MAANGDITRLLQEFSQGRTSAIDDLLPEVYRELRTIAHRQLGKERSGHTLNTTALVHEAYLKLVKSPPEIDWQGRSHFFAIAARLMRQILVNYARDRVAEKRGGGAPKVSLTEAIAMPQQRAEELVALDAALDELKERSERQVQVVEYRFFAGMTIPETAEALNVSVATVNRDWTIARRWLFRKVLEMMGQEYASGSSDSKTFS